MRLRPGLLAVLACFSGGAFAQDISDLPPLRLKFEPALSEAAATVTQGRPTFAFGERAEGRVDRETTLLGDAEVRRSGAVIRGDRLTYYPSDDEVVAIGSVRIARDGNLFTGPEMQLKLDANEGYFQSPAYQIGRFNARGRASQAEFLDPERTRLTQAIYTTCQASDPDWYLRADELTVDQATQSGEGKNGKLVFKDRSILWSPKFTFPLSDERRSGFLSPTLLSNSRYGVGVQVPYYWNIAPNRDFTLYNQVTSRTGALFGGWFRYLDPKYAGYARFDINPLDSATNTTRYNYNLLNSFRDIGGWSGGWNVQGVSDDNYFVDYSTTILTASTINLPRDIWATRSLGDWSLMVRTTRYQDILTGRQTPVYEKLPSVTANYVKYEQHGFDVNTLVDVTQFRLPYLERAEGVRAIVNPQISYPVVRPGWFVTPKLGLNLAQYSLSQNPNFPDEKSLSRALPTFSLDSGLVFERDTSYLGRPITQTLEPRLFYTRTPYKDQSAFPIFDTAVSDFNFAQIFSNNTFVGQDRIADTNQLTAALVSRLISQRTGVEALRLAFGQRYYFTPQRVTLPGSINTTDTRSDLLLAASGDLGGGLNFDSGFQYSLADKSVPRANVGVRYVSPDGRILNFGIRYLRDSFGQVDVSWRQPIARRWMTMGRINYSFIHSGVDPTTALPIGPGLVEGLLGVEYTQDCWLLRFVVQRYVTAANTPTTAFFVQLQLDGLGGIGTNPMQALRRDIPGYIPPSGRQQVSPSRFFGYE